MMEMRLFWVFWLPSLLGAVVFGVYGLRGRLMWQKKGKRAGVGGRRCGGCGYDLRGVKIKKKEDGLVCPECGIGLVEGVNVVSGYRGVSWLWVSVAVVMGLWFGIYYVGAWGVARMRGEVYGQPREEMYGLMSTEMLEAFHFKLIEKPDWGIGHPLFVEFNKRLDRGELDEAYIERIAKRHIERNMKGFEFTNGARVKSEAMMADWQAGQLFMAGNVGNFLGRAYEKGLLNEKLFITYICSEGGVDGMDDFDRMKAGRCQWDIRMEWALGRYVTDYVGLLNVKRMWMDGEVIELRGQSKYWSGFWVPVDEELEAGWHEIELEIEMCVMKDPQNKFRRKYHSLDGVKGLIGGEDDWMRERISKRFYVYGEGEEMMERSMAGEDDLRKHGRIGVMRVNRLDWRGDEAMGVMLKWRLPKGAAWYSHDCYLVMGEREKLMTEIGEKFPITFGELMIEESRSFQHRSWEKREYRLVLDEVDRKWLDGRGKVKLVFRPNGKHVAEKAEVDRIWGGEMWFKEGDDFEVVDLRQVKGGAK